MLRSKSLIALLMAAAVAFSVSAKSKAPVAENQVVIPDYSAYILTPPAPETPRPVEQK